jgi:hypothetical protein
VFGFGAPEDDALRRSQSGLHRGHKDHTQGDQAMIHWLSSKQPLYAFPRAKGAISSAEGKKRERQGKSKKVQRIGIFLLSSCQRLHHNTRRRTIRSPGF